MNIIIFCISVILVFSGVGITMQCYLHIKSYPVYGLVFYVIGMFAGIIMSAIKRRYKNE